MDFLNLAKTRSSIRNYTDQKVEAEKLNQILEAAWVAPTAVNYQPHKVLVVQGKEALNKIGEATNYHGAPLVCVVCADKKTAWTRPFDRKSMVDIDGTIVADHIVMEAESLGLGTCWITYFKPDILKKQFNFPDSLEPVAIITIGYPAVAKASPTRHITERKSIDSIVVYDTF